MGHKLDCRLRFSSLYASGCPKSGGGENIETVWSRVPDSGATLSLRNWRVLCAAAAMERC